MKETFPKKAVVLSEDEYGNKTIKADDGYTFIAVRGSVNMTPCSVGERGEIVWRKSAFYSLPFFVKNS